MIKSTRLRTSLSASTILAAGLLLVVAPARAQNLPDTGNVSSVTSGLSGGAPGSTNPGFSTSGAAGAQTLRVDLKDNRTILNWGGSGFNVAAGNTVDFKDARATSGVTGRTDNIAVLNRVPGSSYLSQIYVQGTIRSDPNVAVYLISEGGVIFGQNSVVDTGAFYASSLDLTNDNDFLNNSNSLRFSAASSGNGISVFPGTTFTTKSSSSTDGGRMGDFVLIGQRINWSSYGGPATANIAGDAALVAGNDVTVVTSPGSPLSIIINRGTDSFTANGAISFDGSMTARNITVAAAKLAGATGAADLSLNGSLTATGASVTDRGIVLTSGASASGVALGAVPSNDLGSPIALDGTINSAANLSSAKDLYVNSSGAFGNTFTQPISALGNIDLAATSGYVFGGPYDQVSPTATVTAGSITLHTGAEFKGAVKTTSGGILFDNAGEVRFLDKVDVAGDVKGTILGGYQSLGLDVWSDFTATGAINVTTEQNQVWQGTTTAKSISLTSTDAIAELDRGIATNGQISIAAKAVNLFYGSATTSIDVTGTSDLFVKDALAVTGITINGGLASLTNLSASGANADITIDVTGFQQSARIGQISATRDVILSNTLTNPEGYVGTFDKIIAGRDISIRGGLSVNLLETLGGTISTQDGFNADAVKSTGKLVIDGPSFAIGDLDVGGDLVVSTTRDNNDAGTIGTATISGNANITSRGTLQLLGNFAAGGDLNVTVGRWANLGKYGTTTSIKANGTISFNRMAGSTYASEVDGLGNITLLSNADGINAEGITFDVDTISMASGSVFAGQNRQGDVSVRNATSVAFGGLSARSLLGAPGTDSFSNGLTLSGAIMIGNATLTNGLFLSGSSISVGSATIANGNLDLRSGSTLVLNGASVANGYIDARAAGATTTNGAISASGDVSIRTTAGNLTLDTNTRINGFNVALATPAIYKNLAGSSAVSAAGYWVIYSNAPEAASNYGGLDSHNTAIWNGTFDTRAPATLTGNRYVFKVQPTLTFSTTDISKVYGTDLTNASDIPYSVTGYRPALAGVYLADTAATAFSGTPLIQSAGFALRATVAGGPYAQTIGLGTLQSSAGYAIAFAPSTGMVTITPKALTASIIADDKTYDGTTAATGSVTLDGVVAGDTVGTTGTTFAFSDKNAGTGKAVAVAGTTLTGADMGNYTLTVPASVLADIFKKALTVTVTANGKTYDGTTATTGTVTIGGVIAGDTVGTSGSTFAFADKNAGTGKTVNVTGTTLTGADASNYSITIPANVLADILKKAITADVVVNNKTYDGTTTGSGSVTLNGVVSGDAVGTNGTTFIFNDKNAGTGKTVAVAGTTLTGADAGNYTVTVPASALADILKKALTATVATNGKTYDGSTDGSGTVTLNGVVSGDAVGTSGTTFTFGDKNAGTGKTVNVAGTTLTGADAGNYSLTVPASVLADILKKALTATVVANNKTYDGTTAGSGTVTLNGVVSGDAVGTGGTSFTFGDKNAGTGKTVTVAGTTLTGTDAGNYTLTVPASALADILKKALTATITADGKTYDGTTAATGTVVLNGVISGETVGSTGTTFAFADKNAGTGKTVNVSGTTLTGADAGNYSLTVPASVLADILKKAITASVVANSKTYDGTTTGTGTVTLNGVLAGDTVGTSATTFTFADKNAGAGKTVTVAGTTLTGADGGNYSVTVPASALADILKKVIAASVTVTSKTYDGTTAGTGTVTLNGVVAGDNVTTSGTTFTYADKNAGTGKAVVVAGTTIGGTDAGNYTITIPASVLGDILKRALSVTADDASKVQNDPDPALTYTLTSGSLVTGDAFSGGVARDGGENPGTYAIKIGTLTAGDNYTITFTPGTFTINLPLGSEGLQPALKAQPLPSQIGTGVDASSGTSVNLDTSAVCGDDKNCTTGKPAQ